MTGRGESPTPAVPAASSHAHEERLALVLDAARAGVWDWSATGDVRWSPEAETLLGLEPSSLAPTLEALFERIHPADRARVVAEIHQALDDPESAEHFESEHRILHPDGTVLWVEQRWRVYRDAGGVAHKVAAVIRDNTRHHELQQQLLHAQKMETVGRLAGGIAHDFNNLLTAIGAAIDLARMGSERSHEHLSTASQAVERAAVLTRQLLTFAKRQPVELRVMDPEPTLAHVGRLLGRLLPETIAVQLELVPLLWPIRADPIQLEQVLVNLAVNARDAMQDHGVLRIRARNLTLDRSRGDVPPGRYLEICVEDDGSGIADEHLPHLFEPFFTTKREGTGLGLATVYGIVQGASGHVDLHTVVGRGTAFTVLLPRADEPAPAVRSQGSPLPTHLHAATVLAVEDNELVRRVLGRTLTTCGYEVLLADGGAQALALVEAHGKPIDLLVTDVVMPEMSGPQLADRLRELLPDVRVLFTSGYPGDTLDLGNCGPGSAFLQKPYSGAVLVRHIEELLSGTGKGDPG